MESAARTTSTPLKRRTAKHEKRYTSQQYCIHTSKENDQKYPWEDICLRMLRNWEKTEIYITCTSHHIKSPSHHIIYITLHSHDIPSHQVTHHITSHHPSHHITSPNITFYITFTSPLHQHHITSQITSHHKIADVAHQELPDIHSFFPLKTFCACCQICS